MKVVIAYFHPHLCEALANTVRKRGHAVETATTVSEGVALLRSTKPSVLVISPTFADGSVDTLLDFARGQRPAPAVFAVSGIDNPALHAELAAKGARRHLLLPLKTDELADAVREVEKERFPFREPRGAWGGEG